MRTGLITSLVGSLAFLSTTAIAGTIFVSPIGGGITLNSGPLSSTVFGNGPMAWNNTSLASAHASLNASGIATNGKITFVAADTDHGLAFLTLIDQELAEQPPVAQGNVHMDSVSHGSNVAFVNGMSPISIIGGSGSQIATGNFSWNSNGGGDAFAWANLLEGNTMTFRFNRISGQPLALDDPSTFQFVTWTGSGWAIIPLPGNAVSFSASNDYGFAATVGAFTPSRCSPPRFSRRFRSC